MSTELPNEPVAWMTGPDLEFVDFLTAEQKSLLRVSVPDQADMFSVPLYAHPADSGMPEQEWLTEAQALCVLYATAPTPAARDDARHALNAHLSRRVAVDRDAVLESVRVAVEQCRPSGWDDPYECGYTYGVDAALSAIEKMKTERKS